MIRASEVIGGRFVTASQIDRSNQLDHDPVEEDQRRCDEFHSFRQLTHLAKFCQQEGSEGVEQGSAMAYVTMGMPFSCVARVDLPIFSDAGRENG